MQGKQVLITVTKPVTVLLQALLDFVYPPYCIRCQSLLEREERLLCKACWNSLPKLDETSNLIDDLQTKLPGEIFFSQAIAIWQYSPDVQTVIHRLKYGNFKFLAKRISSYMAERLKQLHPTPDQTLLIPVPLHKTRKRERGYNQSALICRAVAAETGLPFSDQVLKRIRYTRSQTTLSASERLKNVHKAFKVVSQTPIQNKNVILIDDVITTGATMNECARELIACGAKEIIICAIARA